MQNLSGVGGVTVGYIEVLEPKDLSPIFEGLPGNMCISQHWGYVIDGSMRITFKDQPEELIRAGDVFYIPAHHSGIVDDHVKIVTFSPDNEFEQLMDHFNSK